MTSAAIRDVEPNVVTAADVQFFVDQVLPSAQVQAVVETVIDGLQRWFVSDAPRPEIVLDLAFMRSALPGAVHAAMAAKVASLPACTPAQSQALLQDTDGEPLSCKPPDSVLQALTDRMLPPDDLARLPDQAAIAAMAEGTGGPAGWEQANARRSQARFYLSLLPWGWGVIGVLLLLLALLNRDRRYTPFGWIAAALLLGGGVPLLAALTCARLLPYFVSSMTDGGPNTGLVQIVLGTLLQWIAATLRNISLLVTLAGLGSLIAAVSGVITNTPPGVQPDLSAGPTA
ncbi:MAG TPA: hypothetical protein VGK74_22030 [Symbiobacteriaceae bacterium]